MKNVPYQFHRKLCTIAHADFQSLGLHSRNGSIFDADMHDWMLRKVPLAERIVSIQRIIEQFFDGIDVPHMWWSPSGSTQAVEAHEVEFTVEGEGCMHTDFLSSLMPLF